MIHLNRIGCNFRFVSMIVLLIGYCNVSQAQQAVTLTNGSIIKGIVLPITDSTKVRVQTSDGSQWVFEAENVQDVQSWPEKESKQVELSKSSGYYNISDLGLLMGNDGVYSTVTISAQTVSGYRFNEHWSLGLGVGIESFSVPLAPVFIEGRYYLLKKRFTPFIALQGGYGVPLENYIGNDGKRINRGGVMFNPMVGIKHQVSKNIGLTFSGGYRYQQSITNQNYWWFSEGDTGLIRTEYNRIVFRLGFIFS